MISGTKHRFVNLQWKYEDTSQPLSSTLSKLFCPRSLLTFHHQHDDGRTRIIMFIIFTRGFKDHEKTKYSSSFLIVSGIEDFFMYWDWDELLCQCKKRKTLKQPGCSLWQTMSPFNSLDFSDCNLTHMLEHLLSLTFISANSKMMEDWGQIMFSCWFCPVHHHLHSPVPKTPSWDMNTS